MRKRSFPAVRNETAARAFRSRMVELRRNRGLTACLVLLVALLSGCDHATKVAAQTALAGGGAARIYDGVLELRYAANDDTAFSVLRRLGITAHPSPILLVALASVALLGVAAAWLSRSRRDTPLVEHVGFAFVLAGALGNVVDRAVRGYVVDFIHVTHWPVFNVADVLVGMGIGLWALARLRSPAGALSRDD
jgi:signal peptidase II